MKPVTVLPTYSPLTQSFRERVLGTGLERSGGKSPPLGLFLDHLKLLQATWDDRRLVMTPFLG